MDFYVWDENMSEYESHVTKNNNKMRANNNPLAMHPSYLCDWYPKSFELVLSFHVPNCPMLSLVIVTIRGAPQIDDLNRTQLIVFDTFAMLRY